MTWFKVDDGFHSHPKVIAAGNAAVGLYVRCGSYCAHHLTDGFIPAGLALMYGTPPQVGRLVDVGLWVEADGGWQLPDYLEYNPSRESIQAERDAARARRKRDPVTGEYQAASPDVRPNVARTSPERQPNVSRTVARTSAHPVPTQPIREEQQLPTTMPRKRGQRLPDDWEPSPELVAWAQSECPQVDGRTETEKFSNHWHAASGANAAKLRWDLAWRNWLLTARDRYGPAGGRSPNGFDVDAAMVRARARDAQDDAR